MVEFNKIRDIAAREKERQFEDKIKESSTHYTENKVFVQSYGEKKIMEFLEKHGIFYNYNSVMMLSDENGRMRKVRPDFYLYDRNTVIEYCGMKTGEYEKNMKNKKMLYGLNEIKVIIITPKNLRKIGELLRNVLN